MRFVLLTFACLTFAADAQTVGTGRPLRKKSAERAIRVEPDVDHVFPYVLSSSAWTTTIHITNLEDHPITVACEFVGTDGAEKALTFDFDPAAPTAGTESTIRPFSTAKFHTISTATTLSTSWAYCFAEPRTERFSGFAVVRNTLANGAVRDFVTVLQPESEPVFSVPFLPADDNNTGLILINVATEESSKLAIWLVNDKGDQVAIRELTLPPGTLRALSLNETFKELKEGTIRVVVVEGTKYITGMGLRTSASGYTALPALTPREPAAQ